MNGNTQYPLTKDEEKGLLYGSLLAAGMAALSGRNIPEALQNAVGGFGVAYSGGLSSLLKQKEDELKSLREQEELNLRKFQVESTAGYQDVLKQQIQAEMAEKQQALAARKAFADMARKTGGKNSELVAKAIESGQFDELIRASQPWNIPLEGSGGKPVVTNVLGEEKPIYQAPPEIDVKTALAIQEARDKALNEAIKDAINYAKLRLGNENSALQLITGQLPAGQKVEKEDWDEFKREFYEQLTRAIELKSIVMPDIIPPAAKEYMKQSAMLWLLPWEPNVNIQKPEKEPKPPAPTPKEQAEKIQKGGGLNAVPEQQPSQEPAPAPAPAPTPTKKRKGLGEYLDYYLGGNWIPSRKR